MNWLSLKKARNQLGVSEPVFTVLIRRGLLGYTLSGMVSDQDDIYESLPAIESICPQPPATQTHMRAAPANGTPASVFEDAEKIHTGWMAHFYLVPNYFYFPNPTELSLIWSLSGYTSTYFGPFSPQTIGRGTW